MTETGANRQSLFENALAELRAGKTEGRGDCVRSDLGAVHKTQRRISWRRQSRSDAGASTRRRALGQLQPEFAPRSFTDLIVGGARGARRGRSCAGANVVGARAARLAPDRPEPAFLTCVTLIESGDGKRGRSLKTCCYVFRTLSMAGARSARRSAKRATRRRPWSPLRARPNLRPIRWTPRDWARLCRRSTARRRPSSLSGERLRRRPISSKREWRLERA